MKQKEKKGKQFSSKTKNAVFTVTKKKQKTPPNP